MLVAPITHLPALKRFIYILGGGMTCVNPVNNRSFLWERQPILKTGDSVDRPSMDGADWGESPIFGDEKARFNPAPGPLI